MFDFYKKLLKYCIPLFFFIPIPAFIYYIGLEHLSIKDSFVLQNKDREIKLGKAYSNDIQTTSFYYILQEKPEFLILGASRVANFKCEDFSESCYNANINAISVKFYLQYLMELQKNGYCPKDLLLGLEQWFFNNNFNCDSKDYSDEICNYLSFANKKQHITPYAYRKIVDDLLLGKINTKMIESKNIGVSAKMRNTGRSFLGTGYDYNFFKLKKSIYLEDDHKRLLNSIKENTYLDSRYINGNDINVNTINQLEYLLKFCKDNKIKLYVFLAPFSPDVLLEMKTNGNYQYLNKINKVLTTCVNKYNYPLFDYTEMNNPEITSYNFSDGYHGDPFVYKIITKEILEQIHEK